MASKTERTVVSSAGLSIYRKLAANRRGEAVCRARQLELI
jgi:DNA-binding CsgD family transcriptional regulator